jgi:bifunctional DNA-binding transcriptional regulator/antitoxin component of YhaV-PrlF toxin-antitoxin module
MEARTQIRSGGRLVVPAKFRKALKIEVGDELVMRLENGSIRLIPLHQAVNLAQKSVRKYVPDGVSLVDTLIQERREEASRA